MPTAHDTIIDELREQFAPVLDGSPDGVYIWLDETHKICNDRLASLFGYCVDEWCATSPFLDSFIAPEDRDRYGATYQRVVKGNDSPSRFAFTGVRKDGSTFAAETDIVPMSHSGQMVAYHFVREA
jgi:PAS domain S-box-containing protein